MKIIAFLICCVGFINIIEVQATSEQNIIIQHQGQHMTVIGDRFEVVRGDEYNQFRANDHIVTDDEIIVYGRILHRDGERQYKGFVLILNHQGEVLKETVIDQGEHFEVLNHHALADTIVLQVVHSRDDYDLTTKANYFYQYKNGVLSDPIEIEGHVYRVDLMDGKLYISNYHHGDYQAAIDASFNVYYEDTLYGVVNFGVYEDFVDVFFVNSLRYNGALYEQSLRFDYPGHYYIRYNDNTYQFSVYPSIIGVKDGGVYNDAVFIEVSSGHVFLNDDLYASGERIDAPGHYQLRVEGLNGFDHRIEFTITSNLQGVFDRQIYTTSRVLTFNGQGYLNGRFIESGYVVNESGNYTLEIYGENDYIETVFFELHDDDVYTNQGQQILQYIEVGFLLMAVTLAGGYFIHKKRIKQ